MKREPKAMVPVMPEVAGSGVKGLDEILGGGFPRGEMHLVQGTAGTGKTTIALSYLAEGARAGEAGLYVTLSQSKAHLERIAKSHGWPLEGIVVHELTPPNVVERLAGQQTVLSTQDVELQELFHALRSVVDRVKPRRAVIDSITIIQILAGGPQRYHSEVVMLRQLFTERECTVLFLADHPAEIEQGSEPEVDFHPISGCVIHLEQKPRVFGDSLRRLRVVKSRGMVSAGGYQDYKIRTGKMEVFPRLGAYGIKEHTEYRKVASGIKGLDRVLGGGLEEGTAALFVGAAGTGKSTLSAAFAAAMAKGGGHAAIYLFDERPETYKKRSEELGFKLRGHLAAGRLTIEQMDPSEIAAGEFAQQVRENVEKNGSKVVVIDSLAGYFNAVGSSGKFLPQLHELLTYLSRSGVLTILTGGQEGFMSIGAQAGVDISYLSDAIVMLGYIETRGRLRRYLAPVKKRQAGHEMAIHELLISPKGVRLGGPLTQFRNILMANGVPSVPASKAGGGGRHGRNR